MSKEFVLIVNAIYRTLLATCGSVEMIPNIYGIYNELGVCSHCKTMYRTLLASVAPVNFGVYIPYI